MNIQFFLLQKKLAHKEVVELMPRSRVGKLFNFLASIGAIFFRYTKKSYIAWWSS